MFTVAEVKEVLGAFTADLYRRCRLMNIMPEVVADIEKQMVEANR